MVRQQREWRETEAHFNRLAQSNAPSTFKSPVGSGGNSWFDYDAAQRENERYQRSQQIAENAAKRRSEEVAESNRRAHADLQAKFDAIDRAQAENEARHQRRLWLLNWNKVDVEKAGGLLPAEPAPEFTNDRARFLWHENLARYGNAAVNFDPYSLLVCAQMTAQGQGVEQDFQKVYDFARNAEDRWGLRRVLMAHALIEGIEKPGAVVDKKTAFAMGMEAIKEAIVADRIKPDRSGARDHAFYVLRKVYFDKRFTFPYAAPDVQWRLETAADNLRYGKLHEEMQQQLHQILEDNVSDLPTILPKIDYRRVLAAVEVDAISPALQLTLGRVAMKDGDDFVRFFEPALKRANSVSLADGEMSLRLLHFALISNSENSERAEKYSRQFTPRVWERARGWARWTQDKANHDKIEADAMRILCDWYSGAMGEPADPERAPQWAVSLMLKGDGTGCVRVGNALRAGRGGWPQNDKAAETLFDIGKKWLPRDEKYGMVFAMAEVFAAQPQWKLPANRALQLKYLRPRPRTTRVVQLLEPYIVETDDAIRIATKYNLPEIAEGLIASRAEAVALRDKAQR